MKLTKAFNILDRRRAHLRERVAKEPDKSSFNHQEIAALTTALCLLEEAITDTGACVCGERGRCGHCRLTIIPKLRAELLTLRDAYVAARDQVETAQPAGAPRLLTDREIEAQCDERRELALGLATFTDLPADLEFAPRSDGSGVLSWGRDHEETTQVPKGLGFFSDAAAWLARNRRRLTALIGPAAE